MRTITAAAIMVAATIGEGMFALPYVFHEAGWLVAIAYLAVLASVVVASHLLYFETLRKVGERERLLGLVERYFGRRGFWIGFIAIVGGILLALVAYLILGPRFLLLIFPSLSPRVAFAIFWLAVAIPVLVPNRRAALLEILGASVVVAIIAFVFVNGVGGFSVSGLPFVDPAHLFLPFGIVLLSFAGWTGIEPIYEFARGGARGAIGRAAANGRSAAAAKTAARRGIILGTALVALLYIMFAVGITGAAQITTDTISGLVGWPAWKQILLAALGLFAVGIGSVPLTHEVRNALEKDLRWPYLLACLTVIIVPAAAIFLGLTNFVTVLGLAGGIFISAQYILIISVGRRSLALSGTQKTLLEIATTVFAVAAVYQIASFIVR